ncbi:GTPase IMAP family member 4-like, partial [Clarias magur]
KMEANTTHVQDTEPEELRYSAEPECGMRLVLLGWSGTGKSSVGNTILGNPVFNTHHGSTSQKPVTLKCEKMCASVAGRQ